ncbi:MAG: hypothetical protein JW395_1070 [Nitrospira sp.]|nr:hypothetical protein [Nitrospira sp.]
MKLKGPVFKSFVEPPPPSHAPREAPDRSLPPGKSWLSHNGSKARLRNLTNEVRDVLNSKLPEVQEAVLRVERAVADDPIPRYALLHIIFSAKQAALGAGVTIDQSINYMMDKWDESKNFGEKNG